MKRLFGIIGSFLSAVVLMPWLAELGLGVLAEYGVAPSLVASRLVDAVGSIVDLQGYNLLAAAAAGFGAGILLMLLGGGIDQARSNRGARIRRIGEQCWGLAKALKSMRKLNHDHTDVVTAIASSKVIGKELERLGLFAPQIRFDSFWEDASEAANYYSYYAIYLQKGSVKELKSSLEASSNEPADRD